MDARPDRGVEIAEEILDLPIEGVRLEAATLGGELARYPETLLVFLRHFG